MIEYEQHHVYGLVATPFRVHGSAVYKTFLLSVVSTTVLLMYSAGGLSTYVFTLFKHPYTLQALIMFFSLMLTFRLNMCYARYWESAGAVTLMQAKWLDYCILCAAFHYQSDAFFGDIKPPAFGHYPLLKRSDLIGYARNFKEPTYAEVRKSVKEAQLVEREMKKQEERTQKLPWHTRFMHLPGRRRGGTKNDGTSAADRSDKLSYITDSGHEGDVIPIPKRFQEQFSVGEVNADSTHVTSGVGASSGTGGTSSEYSSRSQQQRRFLMRSADFSQRKKNLITSKSRVPTPSLFLQELAHLMSLLSAVASSGLRNDIEGAASPLVEYIPGKPWPPEDPDDLPVDVKREYGESNLFWTWIYFVFSFNRSTTSRTLYNAARPFSVLGGVSDDEIEQLQRARGPGAKVTLVSMWLQEFLMREHLNGATGNVHPPIISRLPQIISDGLVGYAQAKKTAYIPFPFPHAQITAIFSWTIIFMVPGMYYTYVNQFTLACILNFFTVLCFLGLHETARELEAPFQNTPNDLPLTTWQAQFNEALVCIYAGYHPDSWWKVKEPVVAGDEGEVPEEEKVEERTGELGDG